MRFLFSIILTMLLAALAEYFFAWWTIVLVAFIIALLFRLKPGKAFLAGFLSIAILWLAWTLKIDHANQHILSQRMAKLFSLPGYGWFIGVEVFIGALLGGLGAWSGALLVNK